MAVRNEALCCSRECPPEGGRYGGNLMRYGRRGVSLPLSGRGATSCPDTRHLKPALHGGKFIRRGSADLQVGTVPT